MKAPDNYHALKTLLVKIETRNSPIQLGAASIQTLRYMIENPTYTAVSTMSSIARKNNVNPSTLTRLAYTLGYEKFSVLQKLFRDYIEENASFYTHRANRLIDFPNIDPQSDSIFNTVIKEEASNVLSLALPEHLSTHTEFVERLISARKVRFYGRRQFFSLAVFYSYCLGLIRERVDIMQDDVHGISHSLTYMNESDLLVIVGCAPYTRATVDLCRVAHRHNIPFLSITDAAESPLNQHAEHYLLIPVETHFYSNSMSAAFAQAEALLAVTAQKMGEETLKTLRRREQIIEEFGITLSPDNNNIEKS